MKLTQEETIKYIEYFCEQGVSKKLIGDALKISQYMLNSLIKKNGIDDTHITRNPTAAKKNEMLDIIDQFKQGTIKLSEKKVKKEDKNVSVLDNSDSEDEEVSLAKSTAQIAIYNDSDGDSGDDSQKSNNSDSD